VKRSDVLEGIDTANLMPLSRLDDSQIPSEDPDVRGWDVMGADDKKIGKVEDLLVDTQARRVRHLVVDLDRGLFSASQGQVLVPVDNVRLDRDGHVYVESLSNDQVASLNTYDRDAFGAGTAGLGTASTMNRGTAETMNRDTTNRRQDDRFGTDREAHLTLAEEELAVGKRRVSEGEVGIEKRVETEHVRQSVPVTREEVTVERRPATMRGTAPEIGEDEIRVPLSHEEVTVEKRVVPKEELVIKKHEVQGEELVEADVRRERAEVHRTGEVRGTGLDDDAKRRR